MPAPDVPGGEGLLDVPRWSARYLVSRHHPAPERVRRRLDPIFREALSRELKELLGGQAEGDAVWLIRRLDVDLSVNLAWEETRLARVCGVTVARTLLRTLVQGPDGNNVTRFESRAAYLAAFLSDLAANSAWGKWQYEPFDRLRVLPLSRVLLTAMTESAVTGFLALSRLPHVSRAQVIGALTDADARIALETFSAAQAEQNGSLDRAYAAWGRLTDSALRPTDDWRGALSLYLEACHDSEFPGGRALSATCRGLLHLIAASDCWQSSTTDRVLAALESGRTATLYGLVGADAAEILGSLAGSPVSTLKAVVLRARAPAVDERPSADGRRWTRFGGAFMLLPSLAGLNLEESVATSSGLGGTPASNLLRLVVVIGCFGVDRRRAGLADPVLRDLFGIEPQASANRIVDWVGQWRDEDGATPASVGSFEEGHQAFFLAPGEDSVPGWVRVARMAHALLTAFASRLPGFAASSPAYLLRNFLDVAASVQEETERRVIRLGRPPLGLILDLAGLTRAKYSLSWGARRPLTLFPEEGSDAS